MKACEIQWSSWNLHSNSAKTFIIFGFWERMGFGVKKEKGKWLFYRRKMELGVGEVGRVIWESGVCGKWMEKKGLRPLDFWKRWSKSDFDLLWVKSKTLQNICLAFDWRFADTYVWNAGSTYMLKILDSALFCIGATTGIV